MNSFVSFSGYFYYFAALPVSPLSLPPLSLAVSVSVSLSLSVSLYHVCLNVEHTSSFQLLYFVFMLQTEVLAGVELQDLFGKRDVCSDPSGDGAFEDDEEWPPVMVSASREYFINNNTKHAFQSYGSLQEGTERSKKYAFTMV